MSTSKIPNVLLNAPFVDSRGYLQQVWVQWLNSLVAKVTGAQTTVAPVQSISVGLSPYEYRAAGPGSLMISGGGIENAQFSRDGLNFISIGSFRGSVPMASGDILIVTYQTGQAPTMTFIPT